MKCLEILYEDANSIILNKPAGLAVQGGKGVKCSLDQQLKEYGAQLIHRLDKDTSGVLLAAKGREAAAHYSSLITGKKTIKQYIAVCAANAAVKESRPEQNRGIINDDLLIRGAAKKSLTMYKVIKTSTLQQADLEYSVLELELGTGRMHQIRRHLAMNGNPILGDDKYGDFSLNKKLRKTGFRHLFLHASRLVIKELNLDITAPLPEYFNLFV